MHIGMAVDLVANHIKVPVHHKMHFCTVKICASPSAVSHDKAPFSGPDELVSSGRH